MDRYNARLYLIGLGASLLGNSAMTLVAGIWVKSLTGSSAAAAGALAIGHLGYRVSFLGTAVVTLATAVWLARRRDVAGPSEQAGEFAEHQ